MEPGVFAELLDSFVDMLSLLAISLSTVFAEKWALVLMVVIHKSVTGLW